MMDPNELLSGLMWIESQDLELAGIYHSHPAGSSTPSDRDIEEALGPSVISVIWSRVQERDINLTGNLPTVAISWQAHGFIINRGSASEIDLWHIKD